MATIPLKPDDLLQVASTESTSSSSSALPAAKPKSTTPAERKQSNVPAEYLKYTVSAKYKFKGTAPLRTTVQSANPVSHDVRRHPIGEDCAICKQSTAFAPLSQLWWCKYSCGHNLHKACADAEFAKTKSSGKGKKCGACSHRVPRAQCDCQDAQEH
ncbi:hypothetical protein BU24DRAFT_467196 [Aaosphaeria arxii CBS 175.79]|uniref:RING-type domain-containing protein n=1 Tax=Aaosphaeria arxii CBS 175.79 TaxID=1450172 RepID=A0A6A5XCD6_9PLEO|nr:uncharacterized protein BU24DRAFT_467196 [Aaosphaeria arxii CBS 175.79]KAF2010580.1 hypothetical protein BU24DRAFT_467196 [Aaosphaeria arxii CBS 175.79]